MNNLIIIKVTNHLRRFIRKCIDYQINLYNVTYLDNDNMFVKIKLEDYRLVKRINYYSEIIIIKYEGKEAIKKHFKNNIYIYLIIIFSFILMDVITNFIIRIDIIHENSQIRKLVKNELTEQGIKIFSLAKDFEELEDIREKVLDNNRNNLEWISITREGMTYVVRIEERIITEDIKETGYAHIVAAKDALITKIISYKGHVLVRSGDYVKKGTILISGEIKLYEEIKGNVKANGEIYGEVWYNTDISYPLYTEKEELTGNKRFNIMINNKAIFLNKYQYFKQKDLKKLRILGINFAFYNEVEYQIKKINYTVEEAEKLALKKIEEEFTKKLNGKGKIIEQNVLKKEKNNSTINMKVFVITNELISRVQSYDIGSDIIDSGDSR